MSQTAGLAQEPRSSAPAPATWPSSSTCGVGRYVTLQADAVFELRKCNGDAHAGGPRRRGDPDRSLPSLSRLLVRCAREPAACTRLDAPAFLVDRWGDEDG